MNEATVQQNLAFQVALTTRKESKIARYPRNLKLGVVGVFFVLLCSLPFIFHTTAELTPDQRKAVLEERLLTEMAYAVEDVNPEDEVAYRKKRIIVTHKPETAEEIEAAAENDARDAFKQLTKAPDSELIEATKHGSLPVIAPSGKQPWQAYSRPFNHQDPRPRISVVVGDMGLSRVATDAALHRLPPNVTFAFDGYSDSLQAWLDRARQEGHETLLSIPMEPYDYPRSDPGPDSLLTTLPDLDNTQRLLKFLGKAVGYTGITTQSGSRFSADTEKLSVVIRELKKRGLMIFDTRLSRNSVIGNVAEEMRVPVAIKSRTIDTDPTPEAIDEALMSIEKTARVDGSVVIMASPLPVTLDRLSLWAEGLADRGFVLAPLSAVVH